MRSLLCLLPYLRHEWKALTAGVFSVVVGNLLAVSAWNGVMAAVDTFGAPGATRSTVLQKTAYAFSLFLAAAVFRFLMRYLLSGASRRIEWQLRNDLFAHFLALSPSFYDRQTTGDLISRATNDIEAVRSVLGPGLMYPVHALILFPSVLLLMLKISPSLTALAMVPTLMTPVLVRCFSRATHRRFKELQRYTGVMSERVRENLTGIRVVKAFAREEIECDRFLHTNRQYRTKHMALAKVQGVFFPTLRLCVTAGQMLIVYFAVRWIGSGSSGRITYGGLFAFLGLHAELAWPMIALGWVSNVLERGAASMNRLLEIFGATPEVAPAPLQEEKMPRAAVRAGRITVRNLSFSYNGRPALRDLTLTFEPGSTVGIAGPVGSGKSTLLRLLCRLYPVERGAISIDGRDINELAVQCLRISVGAVPQESFLFSDTLRENLLFGMPYREVPEEQIWRALRSAQFDSAVREFPEGLDTLLGERGVNLSGGQKQRVCLARALIRDPKILLLDDCLSAVDSETERQILANLREEFSDRTVLIVSHRISTVSMADRIVVLERGRLHQEGTHGELLRQDGLYAKLAERQRLLEQIERSGEGNEVA